MRAVRDNDSIAGERVAPFFPEGAEGFSLDYPEDWRVAEEMVADGRAALPAIPARTR